MHGSPESQSPVTMERIEHDKNVALKLLHTCAIKCGHESVMFVRRLWKLLSGNIRPLLVVLPDRSTKDRVFINVKTLQNCEDMMHISLRHDLTR